MVFDLSKKYLNTNVSKLKKSDIKTLQDLIKYHSDLYYNKQTPIISDSEYDYLFKKLEILEERYFEKNTVSSLVGAEIIESAFEKVSHSRPMISLDNTYNEEDLIDFDERVKKNLGNYTDTIIQYMLEFKFDGLGVELIYKNGFLIQAITRGNGIEGEDVTQNILQVENIPKTIKYKADLEVRGEVVMPNSVFEELNKKAKFEGTKIFSNPRNAASGSLRMKDISVTKSRKLKFFAYDVANFEEFIKDKKINTYFGMIESLEDLGFNISSYFSKFDSINLLINEIKHFKEKNLNIDFDIDGLVLKVNNMNLWENIGWTEHHPRYAIAYKFPSEIFTTKILSVDHQVGKTGTITPVANLEAVNIGGVIVKRATLHNYEEVENLDVRIGDTVFIKRAGEVIPKIISVVDIGSREDLVKIFPPKFCPSCETLLKKDDDKVRYYCPNTFDCEAQHIEKLIFAVGKNGFDIDGFGTKQVELFLNEGIIYNLVDIFKIKEKKDRILELDGFKQKSVDNLINAVKQAKNMSIERFLMGLTIPGVGKKTAKTISKLFKSKKDILSFSYTLEDLEVLPDIGPEVGKNVINFFTKEYHKKILSELLDILKIDYNLENKIVQNNFFSDKKVCITGSFSGFSREELVEKLEVVGGNFVSSVSKNTDFLLAGEKAGSKLETASKLGIQVISLEEFLEKIEK